MNAKNFLVSGIVGGIVNFLLGWLFYDIVFAAQFPIKEGAVMNMMMIALGSLAASLFVAYIFLKWANITNWKTALKAGAAIGLFLGIYWNFYQNAFNATANINWQILCLDTALTVVMTAITGAVIAIVCDKMK